MFCEGLDFGKFGSRVTSLGLGAAADVLIRVKRDARDSPTIVGNLACDVVDIQAAKRVRPVLREDSFAFVLVPVLADAGEVHILKAEKITEPGVVSVPALTGFVSRGGEVADNVIHLGLDYDVRKGSRD